jgi:glycosyltransferase involved in cell wall biosynthesis
MRHVRARVPAVERDWFILYRPVVPSSRVQSIQVLCTAHALASLGHRVELCVEGTEAGHAILSRYGLPEVPGLRLHVLGSGTVASVSWRLRFAAFVARTRGRGIVLARKKRNAREALRMLGRRFELVLEVHEVDSVTRPDSVAWRALEAEVLRGSRAVVVNAEGTLELLREAHGPVPPALVAHNAARPGVAHRTDGEGIGIVGSVRDEKDPSTVAAVASAVPGIVWVGADRDLPGVRTEPAIDYAAVPERLARFRTLLLPLSPGPFGERLTSPLKLWDALASGVPLVAADTLAVRRAAAGCFVPYAPGDPRSLAEALDRATSDEALRTRIVDAARRRARTWRMRAEEISTFVDEVVG